MAIWSGWAGWRLARWLLITLAMILIDAAVILAMVETA